MTRRAFITLLGGAAAWPLAARAQQRERMRRIGIVMPFAKGDSEGEARIHAFKQELAKLGWTDGSNIQFDQRWPAGAGSIFKGAKFPIIGWISPACFCVRHGPDDRLNATLQT